MEKHCLTVKDLSRLIEVELEGEKLYDDENTLKHLFENWKNWEIELICFATTLLQILENRQKNAENVSALLERFHSLYRDSGYLLEVDRMDQAFVEYMFDYVRQTDQSIEDNLLDIKQHQVEYKYRSQTWKKNVSL